MAIRVADNDEGAPLERRRELSMGCASGFEQRFCYRELIQVLVEVSHEVRRDLIRHLPETTNDTARAGAEKCPRQAVNAFAVNNPSRG